MYLLDTDVISWTAPGRRKPASDLLEWLERRDDQLFVSAMTIAEIERGIVRLRRAGGLAKASLFADWRDTVIMLYGDRILSLRTPTAIILGRLIEEAQGSGRFPGLADLVIAATGIEYGLTLLTRNIRHYQFLGIACLDPFADQKT